MDEKKVTKFIYACLAFILLITGLFIILQIYLPSEFLENNFSFTFNNPERVNLLVYSQLKKLILIGVFGLLFFILVKYSRSQAVLRISAKAENMLLKVLTMKVLFIIIAFYLIILSVIAVQRYDLGVDEAIYPLYAKHFWSSGYAHTIYNAKIYITDNFTMLPVYTASVFNFAFGLTEVWHFKLLSVLLSLAALYILSRICLKLYNPSVTVLLIFFLVIQPGFGFVASSFFGEFVQAAFFFPAVYIWLKNGTPPDNKRLITVSLLFAVSIQTKFQLSQALAITLILFHFTNKGKKALSVLILTFVLTAALSLIRLIPALVQDTTGMNIYLRFWADQFLKYTTADFFFYIDRAHFFSRFLPVIFTLLLLTGIFMRASTPFEKFLSIFTFTFFIWWIFYFKFTNYRVLFIGIIPLCFLLASFCYSYYNRILETGQKSRRFLIYVSSACILLLIIYGCTQNLIYAVIGNNDAVQLDLDESKSRLFNPIVSDNSQKEFYNEAESMLQNIDSVYVPVTGMACFVPQFYLGEYRIFDYSQLVISLQNSGSSNYVIIDRTAFPLGLDEGYRILDSLHVRRNLILKKGDYELYTVYK